MKHVSKSGAALAAAALTLAISGTAIPQAQAAGDTYVCSGVNACKGQSDCHSYTNSCKGQNSCKGKGWKLLTSLECTRMGGTVIGGN
jgi:uncharacterized membrane protein